MPELEKDEIVVIPEFKKGEVEKLRRLFNNLHILVGKDFGNVMQGFCHPEAPMELQEFGLFQQLFFSATLKIVEGESISEEEKKAFEDSCSGNKERLEPAKNALNNMPDNALKSSLSIVVSDFGDMQKVLSPITKSLFSEKKIVNSRQGLAEVETAAGILETIKSMTLDEFNNALSSVPVINIGRS